MIVRRARSADVRALTELARAAYSVYLARMDRDPAPLRADYAALVESGAVWVAEASGMIVGLLVLEAHSDHLLLENIAVAPEAQGTGVGGRLLRFADEYAQQHALPEVRLYTNAAMTENLDYYPRHGYTETHRGVGAGYRRVFFTKRL